MEAGRKSSNEPLPLFSPPVAGMSGNLRFCAGNGFYHRDGVCPLHGLPITIFPPGLCFGRSLVHTLLVEEISKDSDAYPAYAGNDGIDIQEEGESHTTHQAE